MKGTVIQLIIAVCLIGEWKMVLNFLIKKRLKKKENKKAIKKFNLINFSVIIMK